MSTYSAQARALWKTASRDLRSITAVQAAMATLLIVGGLVFLALGADWRGCVSDLLLGYAWAVAAHQTRRGWLLGFDHGILTGAHLAAAQARVRSKTGTKP